MLSKRTIYGIEALLAIDDEATPTDRQAVLSAARGSWGECSIAEVARRLVARIEGLVAARRGGAR